MSVEADSAKQGLKTAISELHDPAAPVPGNVDGEQLALLPFDRQIAGKSLPAPRGRGRPPGAKNKNTEEWRDFILSRFPSPLEGLAQVMSLPVEELCKMLSCTKLEAFKLQITAMKELAPYLHQKMPLALDTGDKGLINLFFNTLPQAGQMPVEEAQDTIIEVLTEPEENQVFSQEEIEHSNADASNADHESADNAE